MLEEDRLAKRVANKLREDGEFCWREEYEILRRRYELGSDCVAGRKRL